MARESLRRTALSALLALFPSLPSLFSLLFPFFLLFLLYVIFISTVTWLEAAVGLTAAVGAGAAGVAVRRAGGARAGGGARLVRALCVWPAALFAETAALAVAVLRAARGRPWRGGFRRVRWARGTGPAWADALLSSTPGAYVLDRTGHVEDAEDAEDIENADSSDNTDKADKAEGGYALVHTLGPERGLLERVLGGDAR